MVPALIIQLTLVFFAPPISVGSRNLYLSDLWILLWAPWAIFRIWKSAPRSDRRSILFILLSAVAVIVMAWAHGYWRSELLAPLLQAQMTTTEFDTFHPFREAVIALRFFSWIMAGLAVSAWFKSLSTEQSRKVLKQLGNALKICLALCGILILMGWLFLPFRAILGDLYHYGPGDQSDLGRISGTFSSPNEAGLCIVFSGLALWAIAKYIFRYRQSVNILAFVTTLLALLSRSATPLVAAVMSLIAIYSARTRRAVIVITFASALTFLLIYSKNNETFNHLVIQKLGHLEGRIGPWLVYLKVAFRRWDFLLLGTGFNSFYVDNFFLFVFNRVGLVGLAAVIYFLARWIGQNWKYWTFHQQSLVGFSLIASLTLDTFVLRPFASLWIVISIPIFLWRGNDGFHIQT